MSWFMIHDKNERQLSIMIISKIQQIRILLAHLLLQQFCTHFLFRLWSIGSSYTIFFFDMFSTITKLPWNSTVSLDHFFSFYFHHLIISSSQLNAVKCSGLIWCGLFAAFVTLYTVTHESHICSINFNAMNSMHFIRFTDIVWRVLPCVCVWCMVNDLVSCHCMCQLSGFRVGDHRSLILIPHQRDKCRRISLLSFTFTWNSILSVNNYTVHAHTNTQSLQISLFDSSLFASIIFYFETRACRKQRDYRRAVCFSFFCVNYCYYYYYYSRPFAAIDIAFALATSLHRNDDDFKRR